MVAIGCAKDARYVAVKTGTSKDDIHCFCSKAGGPQVEPGQFISDSCVPLHVEMRNERIEITVPGLRVSGRGDKLPSGWRAIIFIESDGVEMLRACE